MRSNIFPVRYWEKLAAILLVVLVIGLPVNRLHFFCLLIFVLIIIWQNRIKKNLKSWILAFGILLLVHVVGFFIPEIKIQEGHNYFTYVKKGEVLEKNLPPAVFGFMKHLLRSQYPVKGECDDEDYCWGIKDDNYRYKFFNGPLHPFAFSGDAVWQQPKYSRIVDQIDFHDQNSLRAGFLNTNRVNWVDWLKDPKKRSVIPRQRVPHFVMYEFPEKAVGGKLCWRGDVLFETGNGSFAYMGTRDRKIKCKKLTVEDMGKKVFGLSILWKNPLAMKFTPPGNMKIASLFAIILKFAGVLGILWLLLDKTALFTKTALKRNGFFIAGALITASAMIYFDRFDFLTFRVHRTGGDGLTYISYARDMLQHLLNGESLQFIRGGRDIFYFMPGMRYFRAFEKIVFGDTNYLYIIFVFIFVLYTWKLIRYYLPLKISAVLMAIFLFTQWLQVVGFTFEFYFINMWAGFPDLLSYTFLLMGLMGMIQHFDDAINFRRFGFYSGISFALAIFMRPNLALMTGVFLLSIAIILIKNRRYKDFCFISAGFSIVLFMPLHNWYFGREFVLFTSSAFIPQNYVSPISVYLQAIKEIVTFDNSSPSLSHVLQHLTLWIQGKYQYISFPAKTAVKRSKVVKIN